MTKERLQLSDDVRNDSSLPLDVVEKRLKDGVEIEYGKLRMVAERHALDQARSHIVGKSPDEKRKMMYSVDRALQKALPKLLHGNFSKRTADNVHADLLLWVALKEVSS